MTITKLKQDFIYSGKYFWTEEILFADLNNIECSPTSSSNLETAILKAIEVTMITYFTLEHEPVVRASCEVPPGPGA